MISFDEFYKRFEQASNPQETDELTPMISQQGYSFINEWILQLEKEVKWADEPDIEYVGGLLARAEEILAEPGMKSPLWEGIWNHLRTTLAIKRSIFGQIAEEERTNEWQVILENPSTNEGITTHARLSFPEAAYLYAKYRKSLSKREYLSLQRVRTFLAENGEQGPSLVDL